ncbi:MAG: LysR family transcriptional regulator, partial [Hyphomicrobiales bacterium]
HLYYFRAIAVEGGIARAAEKLLIGQPTLSAQLKQLEDMVGKPLFERRNHPCPAATCLSTPTASGPNSLPSSSRD